MNIGGKIVLITGASHGIGKELARILVARGAKVALMARGAQALEDLAAELSTAGAGAPAAPQSQGPKAAVAVPADVKDKTAVESAVAAALTHYGRIDVLVNCAGIGYFGPMETISTADFETLVRTNLLGVINVMQAALPALKESRGIIMNISSALGMRALPFLTAYAGTKAMLNAIGDGMRLELAPYGIRVLTFCPPATDTGFDKGAIHAAHMEQVDSDDVKKADVGDVAMEIAAAIQAERIVSGGGFFRVMNALAPRLLDRMFTKMALQIGRKAGMYGAKSGESLP